MAGGGFAVLHSGQRSIIGVSGIPHLPITVPSETLSGDGPLAGGGFAAQHSGQGSPLVYLAFPELVCAEKTTE